MQMGFRRDTSTRSHWTWLGIDAGALHIVRRPPPRPRASERARWRRCRDEADGVADAEEALPLELRLEERQVLLRPPPDGSPAATRRPARREGHPERPWELTTMQCHVSCGGTNQLILTKFLNHQKAQDD